MPRAQRPVRRSFGAIRKLPSGRLQVRYWGPDGVQYSAKTESGAALTFTTRADADAYLASVRTEISNQTWLSPDAKVEGQAAAARAAGAETGPLTFDQYATTWLIERPLADRTRIEYGRIFANRLRPTFGHRPLTEITRAEVRTWHAKQVAEGKPTATAHAFALLRTILGTALDDELIRTNPARIRAAASVQRAKEPVPLTRDQVRAIADEVPPRYKVAVLLGAYCSLRYGEIAGLQRQDVVEDGRTLPDPPIGSAGGRRAALQDAQDTRRRRRRRGAAVDRQGSDRAPGRVDGRSPGLPRLPCRVDRRHPQPRHAPEGVPPGSQGLRAAGRDPARPTALRTDVERREGRPTPRAHGPRTPGQPAGCAQVPARRGWRAACPGGLVGRGLTEQRGQTS